LGAVMLIGFQFRRNPNAANAATEADLTPRRQDAKRHQKLAGDNVPGEHEKWIALRSDEGMGSARASRAVSSALAGNTGMVDLRKEFDEVVEHDSRGGCAPHFQRSGVSAERRKL
jgi:hypothetical protein